jgi:hypothetical protein
MADGDFVWMSAVLAAWRADAQMWKPVRAYGTYLGISGNDVFPEIERLKSGAAVNAVMHARAWLAWYFQPVSDALWDGKTDKQAMRLWAKLRADGSIAERKSIERTVSARKARRELQSAGLARNTYKQGWRANHDWNVVK